MQESKGGPNGPAGPDSDPFALYKYGQKREEDSKEEPWVLDGLRKLNYIKYEIIY